MRTMIRITLTLLLCTILCFCVGSAASAETIDSGTWGDNISWSINGGLLYISGEGAMTDFTYGQNKAWLNYRSNIVSAVIGEGVTSIGRYAFSGCTKMRNVTIPESIRSIGLEAFYNCRSLENVTIPEGVENIGANAFMYCHGLTNVTIPASVKNIYGRPFAGCSNLTEIKVSSDNLAFCDEDGILYSKDMRDFYQFPAGKGGDFAIPESVQRIANGAFFECPNLTSVIIPMGVKTIGDYTFFACDNLNSVTIPKSIERINAHAFENCQNLKDVYYSGIIEEWRNTTIGAYNNDLLNATLHCVEPDLILPKELTTIEEETFAGGAFVYVKLPETCVKIGMNAFAGCPKLQYISISKANAEIDANAFENITNLTILGKAGSTAETYAKTHNFTFIAVD